MAPKADPPAEPSYEEALHRLEKIVSSMEGGDLSLEKLIEHYEEGVRFQKICQDKLQEAEERIQVLIQGGEAQAASDGGGNGDSRP